MTIDMTYWCESCARKNHCYTIRSRPKCFTPITNTAHGTPESYLAKALRFSRDSHEIAKTENSSEFPNNCESQTDCKDCKYVWWNSDAKRYECSVERCPYETEPQREKCPFDDPIPCEWVCTEWNRCKYKPQTDCDHRCVQTEVGCERTDCAA